MSNTAPIELRITRRIAAPCERVFDAWLDPDTMARFLFATPGGVMQQVDNAPHVGGRFPWSSAAPMATRRTTVSGVCWNAPSAWCSRSRPSATTPPRMPSRSRWCRMATAAC